MTSPLTLDALRVLDAIERRGSFAAAAEELFRVPSAITYAVQKLEEDLGVSLFERDGRRSRLTAVGRLVLEQGRLILQASDELSLQARAVASGWEVELVIAVETVVDPSPFYELVERFYRQRQPTRVRVTEEVLAGSWDALVSERCDLVVGASGPSPVTGMETALLGEMAFVLVAAPTHPLVQVDAPLSLAAVGQFPNVVIADSARNLSQLSVGLLDGQRRLTVPTHAQKVAAIVAGAGVGHVARGRVRAELEQGVLVALQTDTPRPPVPLQLAWRRGQGGRAQRWFTEQLLDSDMAERLLNG
ncbi:LysR substrate-binding domain-containing protein [Motiliproteus sediminis]|uniref:LysR substrate-binding domain-containing protein n=1 Tax=Motiliproteus sediminis TaxID=1468178 RepID=UPI001AEF5436|nr:LysR substrate-binding domain-containing protein [Motiliproteus sediminis]